MPHNYTGQTQADIKSMEALLRSHGMDPDDLSQHTDGGHLLRGPRVLLARLLVSATGRNNGWSWARIGRVLGMSRTGPMETYNLHVRGRQQASRPGDIVPPWKRNGAPDDPVCQRLLEALVKEIPRSSRLSCETFGPLATPLSRSASATAAPSEQSTAPPSLTPVPPTP